MRRPFAERGVTRAIAPLLAAEKKAAVGRSDKELGESIFVRGIRKICKRRKAEVPAVLQSIYNDDPSVRHIILSMTPELGSLSLPLLRAALKDEAYLIREHAVMMIGMLGPHALPMVNELAQCLNSPLKMCPNQAARPEGRCR
jgi:HEAT repeat protein